MRTESVSFPRLDGGIFHDLNFSDVGKASNSWSEERTLPDMPVGEAGVSPIGFGYE